MKNCPKCGNDKELSMFGIDTSRKDGLNPWCRECARASRKASYAKNPQKELYSARLYAQANPDKRAKYLRANQIKHPGRWAARTAKRRTAKLQRTPKWLTKQDLELIKLYYEVAAAMSAVSDEPWHVDHEIPLQGETISGFHVSENLQIITRHRNCSEKNRIKT